MAEMNFDRAVAVPATSILPRRSRSKYSRSAHAGDLMKRVGPVRSLSPSRSQGVVRKRSSAFVSERQAEALDRVKMGHSHWAWPWNSSGHVKDVTF